MGIIINIIIIQCFGTIDLVSRWVFGSKKNQRFTSLMTKTKMAFNENKSVFVSAAEIQKFHQNDKKRWWIFGRFRQQGGNYGENVAMKMTMKTLAWVIRHSENKRGY